MGKMIYKNLEEKIDFIKKTEKPYGILLVGSSRKILEGSCEAYGDIDMFVIKENGPFEREVTYMDGSEYDISYISVSDLEYAVEKEVHSLITVLANSETVILMPEAETLMAKIKAIYSRGPLKKSEREMAYNRFRLTKSLDTVEKRLDSVEFDFFVHNYLMELLCFYYESRGEWLPSEKKLVKSITDCKLRDCVDALLICSEREMKLKSLERVVEIVLSPLGGKLYNWDKSVYPFDFK